MANVDIECTTYELLAECSNESTNPPSVILNLYPRGYAFDPPGYSTKVLPIHLLYEIMNVLFHLSWIMILLRRLYFMPYILDDILTYNVYDGQYRSRTYDL